jgi:hypothetical protein
MSESAAVAGMSLDDLVREHGGTLSFHPFSKLLPDFEDFDGGDTPEKYLGRLSEDIRENGQNRKIVMFGGQVLDGRNRYVACLMCGVAPAFEEFEGDELAALQFVMSENIQRRHLTSSQRSMVAVYYADLYASLQTAAEERRAATQAGSAPRDERGRVTAAAGPLDDQNRVSDAPAGSTTNCGTGEADFEGLGISGSIAEKLRGAELKLADVCPLSDPGTKIDLSDLEGLAGLSRAEVIEVERCVEDRLKGVARQPAKPQPKPNGKSKKKDAGEAAQQLAKRFGTNKGYVRKAAALKERSPEKAEEVRQGRKTLTQVEREDRELAGVPMVDEYTRPLSRLVALLANDDDEARSVHQRVTSYLRSLETEDAMQTRKELARAVFHALIPELQQTGARLIIRVNE